MQRESKIDCPVDVWMSGKICLQDNRRGFAVVKLVDLQGQYGIYLTMDPAFICSKDEDLARLTKLSNMAHKNLNNLPKGTAILLCPPRAYGSKFWIARVEKVSSGDPSSNTVVYELSELKRLKNFLESRNAQRTVFRTAVFLVDEKTYGLTEFNSNDISASGISLVIEPDRKNPFVIGESYLLQTQIHEGLTLPALNYRCVHSREDILSGSKVMGFSLQDKKADDPEVSYNLTLLTWQDIPAGSDASED